MKKILLIEDEAALQKTLGDSLASQGYEALPALDGEIGLALAESEKPDLILLDLILPKLHGFEVLKQLKGRESTKNIPVIVLTNLEKVSDVDSALELGATTYLVKTAYSLEEIAQKIKSIIGE